MIRGPRGPEPAVLLPAGARAEAPPPRGAGADPDRPAPRRCRQSRTQPNPGAGAGCRRPPHAAPPAAGVPARQGMRCPCLPNCLLVAVLAGGKAERTSSSECGPGRPQSRGSGNGVKGGERQGCSWRPTPPAEPPAASRDLLRRRSPDRARPPCGRHFAPWPRSCKLACYLYACLARYGLSEHGKVAVLC